MARLKHPDQPYDATTNRYQFSSWDEFINCYTSLNGGAFEFDEETFIANGGQYYIDPQGNRFPCIDMNKVAPLGISAYSPNTSYGFSIYGHGLVIRNIYTENQYIFMDNGSSIYDISFLNVYVNSDIFYGIFKRWSSGTLYLQNVKISIMCNCPGDVYLFGGSWNYINCFGCSFNIRYIYPKQTGGFTSYNRGGYYGTFKNCTFNIYAGNVTGWGHFLFSNSGNSDGWETFTNCKFSGTVINMHNYFSIGSSGYYPKLLASAPVANCLVDLEIKNLMNDDNYGQLSAGTGISRKTLVTTDKITSTSPLVITGNNVLLPTRQQLTDKDWLIQNSFPLMWEDP